jgi:DnaJ-class molecular chaperone
MALEKDDPKACPPCRGTGQVISSLGGEPRKVTCPWCQGSGIRKTPSSEGI